jgi:hypothetical protein
MTPDDKRKVLFVGAVFGAIEVAAANGKELNKQNAPKNSVTMSIPIPQLNMVG